jgi:hypothetical protein
LISIDRQAIASKLAPTGLLDGLQKTQSTVGASLLAMRPAQQKSLNIETKAWTHPKKI